MNLFSGSQKHEDVKTAMKRYCNKKKKYSIFMFTTLIDNKKFLPYKFLVPIWLWMTEEILNVEVVWIPGKKCPEPIFTPKQQSHRTDK